VSQMKAHKAVVVKSTYMCNRSTKGCRGHALARMKKSCWLLLMAVIVVKFITVIYIYRPRTKKKLHEKFSQKSSLTKGLVAYLIHKYKVLMHVSVCSLALHILST